MEVMEKPQQAETKVLLRGTGEELLAHAEEWKHCQNLELREVSHNGTHSVRRLPEDVEWEGTVPLIPLRGRTEAITTEMVKQWQEDE